MPRTLIRPFLGAFLRDLSASPLRTLCLASDRIVGIVVKFRARFYPETRINHELDTAGIVVCALGKHTDRAKSASDGPLAGTSQV